MKFWAAIFVLMLLASAALADDLFPPNWRAEPASQYWAWDTWGGFPGSMPADYGESTPPPGRVFHLVWFFSSSAVSA